MAWWLAALAGWLAWPPGLPAGAPASPRMYPAAASHRAGGAVFLQTSNCYKCLEADSILGGWFFLQNSLVFLQKTKVFLQTSTCYKCLEADSLQTSICSSASESNLGPAGLGWARLGWGLLGWGGPVQARLVWAWPSWVRPGFAGLGRARPSRARPSRARPGWAGAVHLKLHVSIMLGRFQHRISEDGGSRHTSRTCFVCGHPSHLAPSNFHTKQRSNSS